MICRACKSSMPDRRDEVVKYGIRHYLCAECAIARGIEFLLTLKTWQLEGLPFGPLKRAGMLPAVEAEIRARRRYVETGGAR